MSLIPPQPTGVLPGSGYWNDWIERIRFVVNTLGTQLDWNIITNKPTTVLGYGITDGARLNSQNRMISGVDTTDDIIVDTTNKGLVLKDSQSTPHYWRITISNTGVLTTTDLGTTKP
ncbi:MAG: hypothetical protein ACRCVT_06485 [Leadbetterella sp.]